MANRDDYEVGLIELKAALNGASEHVSAGMKKILETLLLKIDELNKMNQQIAKMSAQAAITKGQASPEATIIREALDSMNDRFAEHNKEITELHRKADRVEQMGRLLTGKESRASAASVDSLQETVGSMDKVLDGLIKENADLLNKYKKQVSSKLGQHKEPSEDQEQRSSMRPGRGGKQ